MLFLSPKNWRKHQRQNTSFLSSEKWSIQFVWNLNDDAQTYLIKYSFMMKKIIIKVNEFASRNVAVFLERITHIPYIHISVKH